MVDEGNLISTSTGHLGYLSVENLMEAHRQQESGSVMGKNILTGF